MWGGVTWGPTMPGKPRGPSGPGSPWEKRQRRSVWWIIQWMTAVWGQSHRPASWHQCAVSFWSFTNSVLETQSPAHTLSVIELSHVRLQNEPASRCGKCDFTVTRGRDRRSRERFIQCYLTGGTFVFYNHILWEKVIPKELKYCKPYKRKKV